MGDDFLVQYFVTGRSDLRESQILPRLFSMGHSLELYAKSALVSPDGTPPMGHNVPDLVAQVNANLSLTEDELAAGNALFENSPKNIDLGIWTHHQEAMELYQAMYFLRDLKYYVRKDGSIIFPARMSLLPLNTRFLSIIHCLRASVEHRTKHQDDVLLDQSGRIGFEINPALQVV